MQERGVIAAQYPRHVFLTYNDPAFDALTPTLPKMYLYSLDKWKTAKPWFS
jgi:hypothetical protein